MLLSTVDIALRGATVALLLVLAASLFRGFGTVLAGRLAAAFALGSAAHAVSYSIGATSQVTTAHAPLVALSTGNVVVFWLFTRALFDETFKLRWWHGLLWAAVATFSFVNCTWLATAPGGSPRMSIIAINLISLGFIILAVAQTIFSWSSDLVERRRGVRVFIVGAAAVYGGLNAILQILWSGGGTEFASTVNSAALAAVVAAISFAMMRVDGADLFPVMPAIEAEVADPQVADSGADQKLVDALMRLMADERIYRHDNISIGTLATKLKIPEYRLRRLINQRLGYRNFNVFLNAHRIAEAKAALADPSQAEVPVITIAMDAGFQSLGPFNRAFKATTGVTPSEYRKLKASAA
jgi:AraC-like DNA-binding protein